jgi:hypothetical protein
VAAELTFPRHRQATAKDGSIVIARYRRRLSPSARAVASSPKTSVRTRTVASLHAFVTGHVEPRGNGLSPTYSRATAGSVSSATSTTCAASDRTSLPRKPGPLPLGVHRVSSLAELLAGLQPTRDGGLGAPRQLADGMRAPLQCRKFRSRGLVLYRALKLAVLHLPARHPDIVVGEG